MSHGQSSYVLQRLIKDRRVSAGDIQRYVGDMAREIQALEQQLASLREAHGGGTGSGGGTGTGAGTGTGTGTGRGGRRRGRPPGRRTAAAGGISSGGAPAAAPGRRRRGRPPASASAQSGEGQGTGGEQAGGAKRGRRRRSAITPEQLASRQLQGRYLALIRQVPESRRGQYAKIAKEKGREAAIRELQDVVKK